MIGIVDINPVKVRNWRGIYYEVYDKEHANPQNLDGWVGTFTKSELETYKKDCGKYVFIKIQEGETA